MSSLGAGLSAVSAYKWCGPHAGAVVASPELLWTLQPDKLEPSTNDVPERLVRGTISRLTGIPGFRMVGSPTRRTGTICFTVDPLSPGEVAARLGEQDINVWSGHACAWELTRVLGIRDTGGAIRVSLAPYTAESDLDRLLAAMSAMATCDDE